MMEDSSNLILQYWWIVEHKAKEFADGEIISFEIQECKRTCTRHNCNCFTIEIDDTILGFGNDHRRIGIIETLKIDGKNEIGIGWIDRIPW